MYFSDDLVILRIRQGECRKCKQKTEYTGYALHGEYCIGCRKKFSVYRLLRELQDAKEHDLQLLEKVREQLALEANYARNELEKLNWQKDAKVQLSFDSENRMYTIEISQNGECLEKRVAKEYQRYRLVTPLSSIRGEKVRVPWKRVIGGETWTAEVYLEDWYLERLKEKVGRIPNRILNMDAHRVPLN